MKKALSLILALILCLPLCACGGDDKPDDQPEENTVKMDGFTASDGLYIRPGTSANEAALYAYDLEWTIEDEHGSLGLPAKLKFQSGGTCTATYPDRQENLCWGYAPGADMMFNDLYVRVGTPDDVLYLFHVHLEGSAYVGSIAQHCFVSANGIPVAGLTEDGHELYWVSATSVTPNSGDSNDQPEDNNPPANNNEQTPDNSEQAADSYEKIELTAENWNTYFELTEKAVFSKNLFGENDRLDIIHAYKLKEGYGAVGEETKIIIEYSYCAEVRKNCKIDFPAETYILGEDVDSRRETTEMTDYSTFSDEGYGWSLAQSYNYDNDRIRYCSDYKILRVQGTLCLKKN